MKKEQHPLRKLSIQGHNRFLKELIQKQKHVFSKLIIQGQSVVVYAAPNTGKTLLMIAFIIKAIKENKVDPDNIFYVNVDDSLSGIFEKNAIAEEYHFHKLVDGHNRFKSSDFLQHLEELSDKNLAYGVIVIVDTIKRFVNLMDKKSSSSASAVFRRFTLKGGTIVMLAHTNKRKGEDGKPIYSGTSDLVDDSDCAFLLYQIAVDPDDQTKVVKFENIKNRGDVSKEETYKYSIANGLSYDELLGSVEKLNEIDSIEAYKNQTLRNDSEIISSVKSAIEHGHTKKMDLIKHVSISCNISKRTSLAIIDKYCGSNHTEHLWNFSVQDRGAKIFYLLEDQNND